MHDDQVRCILVQSKELFNFSHLIHPHSPIGKNVKNDDLVFFYLYC